LKAIGEKKFWGKPIKIIADFSTETLKARMKITSTLGYSTQQNYHSK
jgi:hypothetical protein